MVQGKRRPETHWTVFCLFRASFRSSVMSSEVKSPLEGDLGGVSPTYEARKNPLHRQYQLIHI